MKYFCIGAWKTATTTLGFALNELVGGAHRGWHQKNRRNYLEGKIEEVLEDIDNHNTFDDTPFNTIKMIHIIKDQYPDAKFILPVRDSSEWIDSMIIWNFDDMGHPMIGHTYKNGERRIKHTITDEEAEYYRSTSFVYRIYKEELDFFNIDLRKVEILSENKDSWISWINKRKEYLQELLGDRLLTLEFSKENPLQWEPLSTWVNKHNPDVKIRYGKMEHHNANKVK